MQKANTAELPAYLHALQTLGCPGSVCRTSGRFCTACVHNTSAREDTRQSQCYSKWVAKNTVKAACCIQCCILNKVIHAMGEETAHNAWLSCHGVIVTLRRVMMTRHSQMDAPGQSRQQELGAPSVQVLPTNNIHSDSEWQEEITNM